jgi:hypothetical protein
MKILRVWFCASLGEKERGNKNKTFGAFALKDPEYLVS